MPALTTHKIFAERILNNIDKNLIDKNTYYMFSQSHDILFYYIGKNKKHYKNIGKKGHHKSTKQFIINTLNCIKNNNLETDKQCISFLMGIITHYYLDSTLHPYIFYKTGVYRKNNATLKYKGKHNKFERQLDKLIYERTYNKDYKECKIHEEIIPEVTLNNKLSTLINVTYNKTYKEENMSKIINKGYKTMRLFHKLIVNDPKNIKIKIYKLIDKIFETNLNYYTNSINAKEDILNLNKKSWYHPSDIKIKSNKSINDLINTAEKECTKTIKEVIKYLQDERNEIDNIIKDIDYSSGLEIKDNKKMRYFEY